MKTIFISIAAFCDPHLRFTLESLFTAATHPERLHVAIVDQSADNNLEWVLALPHAANVQYIQFHPVYSRGVSWARSVAFSCYRDEDLLLQIDSHTWFDPGWDERLIAEFAYLRTLAARPILTAYPPPFEFDEAGRPFKTLYPDQTVYWMQPIPGQTLSDDNLVLTFRAENVADADFVPGYHIAGGMLFTTGDFVHDVPYDPFMYFHGEEQNIVLRAFTRGWTIFNPQHDNIPLFHLYRAAGQAHPTQHWREDFERARVIKSSEFEARARARLHDLIHGKRGDQPFGLGRAATLADFARESGIDYLARTIDFVPPVKIKR